MKVTVENEKVLLVRFDYSPAMVGWIKAELHGRRWNPAQKAWRVSNTVENKQRLAEKGFVLPPDMDVKIPKAVPPVPESFFEDMPTKLRAYQKEGVAFLNRVKGRGLVADEMGLGKTIQAIAWIKFNREKAGTVLVICPASLKENWRREFEKHGKMNSTVVNGGPAEIREGRITIINYDRLKNLPDDLQVDTVVLDEAHYVKNQDAKRSKATKAICKKAKHVIALTGTPITSRPMDIWNAVQCIQPGLFPSRHQFGKRYCGAKYNGFGWEYKGATNIEELNKVLTETVMIRRKKTDVLKELPDKLRSVVDFQIENRSEYNQAEQNLIAWLIANKSKEAARRAARAEQIARFQYLKTLAAQGKINGVVEWVNDFLDSTGEKIVLFAVHKEIVLALHEAFPDSVTVTGGKSMAQRQEAVDAFQNDPKCRVFIGNITAAGVGLTLTAASTVAFVEMGWTPGEHLQAEDRIHRIGQTELCSIYYLVASETIEEEVAGILDSKQKVIGAVLDNIEMAETDMITKLLEKYTGSGDVGD